MPPPTYEVMNIIAIIVIPLVTSAIASGGLWAFIVKKTDRSDARLKLLLGLAHDRIVSQGLYFIQQGSISKDEYHDLIKYLYEPYSTFGGNGLAEKIMDEVRELPFTPGTELTKR